ncbi:DUF4157 domain-containing protein [Roseofilum casamattae]|uniref:DUF4157 domain-containing protein n=1 Tax=Roseofilum casamattae BLCC-M143 TaxID=3022442 RepID=A0ABT7BWY3_9CYAN|nr:DUF4157 domain-containing protein [Roseofilum casamattae]MDJ1183704.1 DUF4157 domain-containing protein [Roseofilum casamattae BLCC-M143]
MATRVKARVPETPTPAAPVKNPLPPLHSFVEPSSATLETSTTESPALQTLLANPHPPNENGRGTVIQEKNNERLRAASSLGYRFGEISVAPASSVQDAKVQSKVEESDRHTPLKDGSFNASKSVESRIQAKQGGGRPLPDTTRSFMEDRFGNDFSQVRIHTDSTAVQLSQDLQAKAFTHGRDIYFNSGYYNPSSNSGKHLLAHELTHTIQQKGAQLKPKTIQPKTAKSNKISPVKKTQLMPADNAIKANVTRKPLARRIQRTEEKSGIDVNLKPLAAPIQRKAEIQSNEIDVTRKPLGMKVQRQEQQNGVDINLKPLASQIQRTQGNPLKIQPELIVGAPNDPYEQEADRMADAVMNNSSTSAIQSKGNESSDEINLKPLAQKDSAEHSAIDVNLKPEKEQKEEKTLEAAPAPMLNIPPVNTDEQNVNITLKRDTGATPETNIRQPSTGKSIQRAKRGRSKKSNASLYQPLFGGGPSHGGYKNEEGDDTDVFLKLDEEQVAVQSPEVQSAQTDNSAPVVQASSDGSFTASSNVENKVKSSEGGGSSLSPTTKNFMESRFDNDFSNVRVHTDSSAVQMNKDLGAKAFTHKNDIYFNSGQYNPSSSTGKHLIAHELTHTIQQTGPSVRTKPDIQKEGDNQNKKSIAQDVNENTTELSDEDYSEKDLKKLKKDANKTEEQEAKDKGKKKNGGEGGEQEGEDGADEQGADVVANATDESAQVDVAEDLKKGMDSSINEPPVPVVIPDVLPGQVNSDDPLQNPAFIAVTQQVGQQGEQFSKHDDPQKEVVEVQDAVVDENQPGRKAQESKTDATAGLDPQFFDREAFVQQLFAALGIEEPKNMDEVKSGGGIGSQTEGAIDKGVGDAKKNAGGGIPEATQVPLAPKEEDMKPVKEMESIEGKVNDMTPIVPQVDKAAPPATSREDVEDKFAEQQEGLKEAFGDFQAKLIVGGPQDKYEVEADRMADTVMGMSEPQPQTIQAKSAPEGTPKVNQQTKEDAAQMKRSALIERQIIQAKSLARTIHRSPKSLVQRKEQVEVEQAEAMDLGTGTGKTISTKDMETFSDMGGDKALQGLQQTERFSQEGPQEFRKQEEGAIANTKTRNQERSQQTTESMQNQRAQTMTDMTVKKQETKGANEAARLRITEELNSIYSESQAKVNGILTEMDGEVKRRMELGKRLARHAFEVVQRAAFKKWQTNYYYHRYGITINLLFVKFKVFNIFLWLKERLFTGLPDEVNKIYSDAKEVYVNFLRQSIAGDTEFKPKVETGEVKSVLGHVTGMYNELGKNAIAPYVEQKMSEAKTAIDEGKAKFKSAVEKLGPEEKQLAQGAVADIQGKFNNLENNVKSYQDNLVNQITESYKQGLKEIDDRIKQLKDANRGWIVQALDFILDIIKKIIKFLLTPIKWAFSLLGIDPIFIDALIDDPGGFMSNFFGGLKDGFLNFVKNFPKHFLNGLVEWLFGNIGPIKLPKKFDLKGFFDIFLQIMGFSKDAILAIAAEVFGYDIVNAIKEAIEGADINEIIAGMGKAAGAIVQLIYTVITKGPAAAWEFIIDIIDEMKGLFIKELSIMVSIEIVKAAVMWLIGLLNPASAIIKIIKAVVQVIIFFVENYKKIIELIKTIFAGLAMIARGDKAGFSKAVEMVLAGLIPIGLSFLASLIGIGGIANKIRKIVKKVTGPFRKKLKKLFDKVAAPFKKAFGKAKAWGTKKYNSAKEWGTKKYNNAKDKATAAKDKFKEKFTPKKKKDKKKTEKEQQRDEYKRKVEKQKTEVKQIISQGESRGEQLIEDRRDPKEVKKGLKNLESSVEEGKEFAQVKSVKVSTGMMGGFSNKYTLTGTIKKLKIPKKSSKARRQPVAGNANLPAEALQAQADPMVVQLKKDKWKDKKNKLIVDDKSSSSKFILEARLIDESDVLSVLGREIERKARKFQGQQPTVRFKPLLPKYKKQYDLTSINLANRTGLMDRADRQVEYEITARVPVQETNAKRKEAPGSFAGAPLNNNIELRIQRSQGKGEPLSSPVRQPMEQAFGTDFSGVRIHRKTEGDTLSRSLNAKAFTTGQDIYFRSNTYRPNTSSGGHLLAHELTHVVQQSGEKPQVQRSPFFPNQLIQRQGDGPPPRPLLSQHATIIQRDGEDDVPDTEGGGSGVAVGAVLAGTAVKLMDESSQSGTKTNVDVYKDIDKKKGTLDVFVRVQKIQKEQEAGMPDDLTEGIPDFTRTLIARYIERIIQQDPAPDIVTQKLPEVVLKFDLDMVKLAGYTQVGESYEYTILVEGNPKSVARKKIEAMLKKMAKLVSPNKELANQQQDGSAELPSQSANSRKSKNTENSRNTETPGETQEGTRERQERSSSNVTTQRPQPTRKARPTNTQTAEGEMAGAPPALSTKTQIKPTGNPKTFYVKARVDPEDRQ